MNDNDASKVTFKRTQKGKHNIIGNEEELLNNDNSLDKPGTQIGGVNFTSTEDSFKDMPLYGRKDNDSTRQASNLKPKPSLKK